MKALLVLASLLFVLPAHAWRETNNGGGITEQNIIYLHKEMYLIAEPIAQKNNVISAFIYSTEKAHIHFQNQEVENKKAFIVDGYNWWIQTRYLGDYDIDQNDELNWAECVQLLFDIYSQTDQIELNQALIAKKELLEYFSSAISQKVFFLEKQKRLQLTSVIAQDKSQSKFAIQLEGSTILSLKEMASTFAGCDSLEKSRFQSFVVRSSKVSENKLEVLATVKMGYKCAGQEESVNLILMILLEDKKIYLQDWGRQ